MLADWGEKVLNGCHPFYEVAMRYPARTAGALVVLSTLLILANRPEDEGEPLCAEVASKIFNRFQTKMTEREREWLGSLERPRQWKALKSALPSTALTPFAERGVALIERVRQGSGERFSFWILIQEKSPRWNELYTQEPTLFDLARLRSELDRVSYLVRNELLPGTEALHATFPDGGFKERLGQLVEQMKRANQSQNDLELVENSSSLMREGQGSYLALLLEIQASGSKREKKVLASWIEEDRRRRRPIIGYPETLVGDLAASWNKTTGQRLDLDQLSFNSYDLAELTLRIVEAIP